jgi:hypothetical protein
VGDSIILKKLVKKKYIEYISIINIWIRFDEIEKKFIIINIRKFNKYKIT